MARPMIPEYVFDLFPYVEVRRCRSHITALEPALVLDGAFQTIALGVTDRLGTFPAALGHDDLWERHPNAFLDVLLREGLHLRVFIDELVDLVSKPLGAEVFAGLIPLKSIVFCLPKTMRYV